MKTEIPHSLIFFRLILVPTLILLAYKLGNSIRLELVILIFIGLISDIFDGIIARKLNVSSEKL